MCQDALGLRARFQRGHEQLKVLKPDVQCILGSLTCSCCKGSGLWVAFISYLLLGRGGHGGEARQSKAVGLPDPLRPGSCVLKGPNQRRTTEAHPPKVNLESLVAQNH